MCLFCAAVPVTASVGIAAQAKWKEKCKAAELRGEPLPKFRVPLDKVTGGLVVGLVITAAVYHTTLAPKLGIW